MRSFDVFGEIPIKQDLETLHSLTTIVGYHDLKLMPKSQEQIKKSWKNDEIVFIFLSKRNIHLGNVFACHLTFNG